MVKNLIEEIQEIVQYIETNYQEEVDYNLIGKKTIKEANLGVFLQIISPRLKKFCREKFNFPSNIRYLDYEIGDEEGNDFYYRIFEDYADHFELSKKIGNFRNGEKEKPKKCKNCGEMCFYEKGQIAQWSGTKTPHGPRPNIIAYFHPQCAKKYFADKERPDQNEVSRLKEKLLRNLDKICIDPLGDLANAELIKDKEIENNYYWKPVYGSSEFKKILSKIYKVNIEGEEIDLEKYFYTGSESYCDLKRAIIQEIKQNPQDWHIDFSPEGANLQHVKLMVRHRKSGRRHWKHGIEYLLPSLEKEKYWAEIETVLNDSTSPTPPKNIPQLTSNEKELIRNYMEKNGFKNLVLFDKWLIVSYKDNHAKKLKINNSELQNIKKLLEKTTDKSVSFEQIKDISPNQSKSPDYTLLWIGLSVVGGIIIGILITCLSLKRKRKSKQK